MGIERNLNMPIAIKVVSLCDCRHGHAQDTGPPVNASLKVSLSFVPSTQFILFILCYKWSAIFLKLPKHQPQRRLGTILTANRVLWRPEKRKEVCLDVPLSRKYRHSDYEVQAINFKPTIRELNKGLLCSLKNEHNPITHSDIGKRTNG